MYQNAVNRLALFLFRKVVRGKTAPFVEMYR